MTVWKLEEDRGGRQSTSGGIRVRVASGRILQFGEWIGRKIPRQEFGHIVWCFAARTASIRPSAPSDFPELYGTVVRNIDFLNACGEVNIGHRGHPKLKP